MPLFFLFADQTFAFFSARAAMGAAAMLRRLFISQLFPHGCKSLTLS